jgi:hypothetical protein
VLFRSLDVEGDDWAVDASLTGPYVTLAVGF